MSLLDAMKTKNYSKSLEIIFLSISQFEWKQVRSSTQCGWFDFNVIITLEWCVSFADSFVRFESFDEVNSMISVIASGSTPKKDVKECKKEKENDSDSSYSL